MKIREVLKKIKEDQIIAEARAPKVIEEIVKLWSDKFDRDTAINYLNWFDSKSGAFSLTKKFLYTDPVTNQTTEYERISPPIAKFLIKFDDFSKQIPRNPNATEEEKKKEDEALTRYLKDPYKYTAEQVKFLRDEFNWSANQNNEVSVFTTNPDRNPTDPQKIDRSPNLAKGEASKDLWFNNETAIINENGFRVYRINSQQESINFGYYLTRLYDGTGHRDMPNLGDPYNYSGSVWCVTSPSEGSTYYGSKRADRTFYYVIDEDKHPSKYIGPNAKPIRSCPAGEVTPREEKYFYLSALQVFSNGRDYAVTGIHNPGEPRISWEQVIQIYPKLVNHKNTLKHIPLKPDELINNSVLNQISESPGSTYEFYKLPARIQHAYINGEGRFNQAPAISKAISWRHMEDKTKKLYIEKTTARTYEERFSTFELLYEIKKQPQMCQYLNRGFKDFMGLDITVEELIVKLIKRRSQFKVYRRSKKNSNVEILLSLSENRYCIFDSDKVINSQNALDCFYTKNGITYGTNYTLKPNDEILTSQDGELYLAEVFVVDGGGIDDNRNFYSIVKLSEDATTNQESYFFSQQQYKELIKKYFEGNEEEEDVDVQTAPGLEDNDGGEEQGDPVQTAQITTKQKKDLPSFSDIFEIDKI